MSVWYRIKLHKILKSETRRKPIKEKDKLFLYLEEQQS